MTVYEIEWRIQETVKEGDTPDPDKTEPRRVYTRTKTEAIRVVGGLATTPMDGDPTVYKCELDCPNGHVATILALLNGDIKPARRAIVHGQLPLPLQG